MKINIEQMWETTFAVILAVAGGFARLLSGQNIVRMKKWRIWGDLFIAGFAGFLVVLLARIIGLNGDWLCIVGGMAGWSGPKVLDQLEKVSNKKTGLDPDEEKESTK